MASDTDSCNSARCYIGEPATHRMFSPTTLFYISLHYSIHRPSSFLVKSEPTLKLWLTDQQH